MAASNNPKKRKQVSNISMGIKNIPPTGINDFCEICSEASEQLMLCDGCNCRFHVGCLSMVKGGIPEIGGGRGGKWFCDYCRCSQCSEGVLIQSQKQNCAQCRRSFHLGSCHPVSSATRPCEWQGAWFCQEICMSVFMKLRRLVGKEFHLEEQEDEEDLSVLLLRSSLEEKEDNEDVQPFMLREALAVLREGFCPIVDARTNIDLLAQIVFNRKSEVSRVDCNGFYTVVAKKGPNVACVATLRIHGTRVAEVPLVATARVFRKEGICKAMMKAMERLLAEEIRVEEMVLPSIDQMVSTWKRSFGFKELGVEAQKDMAARARLMAFPGTTLLHKTLLKRPMVHRVVIGSAGRRGLADCAGHGQFKRTRRSMRPPNKMKLLSIILA